MLLMVEKELEETIHRYAKANNKYLKNYDKNKESSYIRYLDANNLFGWAMSQKLPVYGFKWVKYINLNKKHDKLKKFVKNYGEESNKGYILEVDVEYPKSLHNLHRDLPFLAERMRINKCHKLVCNCMIKETILFA